jgi:hypothetical protein
MLAIEVEADGAVVITATERELRDLASHLLRAAVNGEATPGFVTKRGGTFVRITRLDD